MRRTWLLVLASGSLAVGLIVNLSGPTEPKYQGRSLSSWLDDAWFDQFVPVERKSEAPEAIRAIGTNAVPHFLKWLQFEEPAWLPALERTLVRAGLMRRKANLMESARRRVEYAQWGFGVLGAEGNCAIPALVRLMSQSRAPQTAAHAAAAIAQLGTPEALGAMVGGLTNHQEVLRSIFAYRIREYGTNALPAVPALVSSLGDADPMVRKYAADTLRIIKPEALTNQSSRVSPEALTNALAR